MAKENILCGILLEGKREEFIRLLLEKHHRENFLLPVLLAVLLHAGNNLLLCLWFVYRILGNEAPPLSFLFHYMENHRKTYQQEFCCLTI